MLLLSSADKKILVQHYQSVKQFGSRLGPMVCPDLGLIKIIFFYKSVAYISSNNGLGSEFLHNLEKISVDMAIACPRIETELLCKNNYIGKNTIR